MVAIQKQNWTVEEYLAMERASEEKHEFLDGEIYLMSGASRNHNLVTSNVIISLGTQLQERPCSVYPSDIRVKISDFGQYTYPDVTVVCDPEHIEKDQQDTLLNPIVIIEVLSPSTEVYDRGKKFQHYRELDSLQEYVLIAQDQARIERYLRQPSGEWLLTDAVGLEASLELPSIDCTLALAGVYRRVSFEPEEAAPPT